VDSVFVVFNPRSGKGRGGRLMAPVLAALAAEGLAVEHGVSEAAGDEARLASEALGRGFRHILAVGGDGTWSNVADALLKAGARDAALGLIPGGTGCDLAKSLGIPARDLAACARIVRAGRTRAIDVGRVEQKHFLNVVGFGFDIAVIEDSWRVRYLGGDLLYLYCALRQIYSFPGFPVELAAEAGPGLRQDLMMLVIANARVFGGGFRIAPSADLGDGRLDAMAFRNMPLSRRLVLMGRLMRGTHEQAPEVSASRARCYRLRFDAPPAYETDGEWNRASSCELLVESLPAALRVLVPDA
jgi:diacylglycerol kinase (ATP)